MPPPAGSTIYEPTGYTPGAPVNLLLCCHSAGRTSTDPFGTEGNACIASAQAAGYLCAASDAQNTAWGNAASCADYLALVAYCEATYNVQGVMLWGSSMGGLNALTLAGYLRGSKVRGALLIQAVCDLNATYVDHPAFQTTIDPAYGMSGYSAVAVGAYDPIDRPTAEYAALRYRFYASAGDTFVSKSLNTDAMAAKIASVAREADVVAVSGDHGDASHWNWSLFAPFIARVFADYTLVIDESDADWEQAGDGSVTVDATAGFPADTLADVTSEDGGLIRFDGTHASRFQVSADGSSWASTLTVTAGTSIVHLRCTPLPGDTTLTAQIGVQQT